MILVSLSAALAIGNWPPIEEMIVSKDWFKRTTEEIVNTLDTDVERGLPADIAAARLLKRDPTSS